MTDTSSKFNSVVERLVAIRDQRAELKKQYEEQDRKLRELFARGEAWVLDHLTKAGATSMKGPAGTAFVKEDMRVSLGDWDALAQYVVDSGDVDMLEHRVSKTAVKTFMEQNKGELPPGVTTRTERVVQIRRA